MPASVGNSESAGGRNARSRDGMTSASNDTRSFSSRCLLLVLVVGARDRRIHALIHRYDETFPVSLPRARRCPLLLNDSRPSVQRQK